MRDSNEWRFVKRHIGFSIPHRKPAPETHSAPETRTGNRGGQSAIFSCFQRLAQKIIGRAAFIVLFSRSIFSGPRALGHGCVASAAWAALARESPKGTRRLWKPARMAKTSVWCLGLMDRHPPRSANPCNCSDALSWMVNGTFARYCGFTSRCANKDFPAFFGYLACYKSMSEAVILAIIPL